MADELSEYLDEHPCRGFTAVPHYFADGDFITYYFRNERCYAQRVDDVLTVYRAFDSQEMVGCKIKSVRHILNAAGDFNLLVADGGVRLAIFFFVGAVWAKDEAQRKVYEELRRVAMNAALTSEELQPAVPK